MGSDDRGTHGVAAAALFPDILAQQRSQRRGRARGASRKKGPPQKYLVKSQFLPARYNSQGRSGRALCLVFQATGRPKKEEPTTVRGPLERKG